MTLAHQDRLDVLLEVSRAAASHLDLGKLLAEVAGCLARTIRCEWTSLSLLEPDGKALRVHALQLTDSRGLIREGEVVPLDQTPAGRAVESRTPFVVEKVSDLEVETDVGHRLVAEGLRSGCCIPLVVHERILGTLDVGSRRESAFGEAELDLLSQVALQVAPAIQNALTFKEAQTLRERLAAEKLCLEKDLKRDGSPAILGHSVALRRALDALDQVAPTNATVLIVGETGTGKELFARAVHDRSPRAQRSFVALNCAAIPATLIESELFGHEKGAYTGATSRHVGRFELADGGTLFLDEVGELPLELQAKLLRVLQERKFERVGGTRTLTVDVRIVAATNRDLERLVADGKLRADLFYRLNVFPLALPPLRERPEDLPLLVDHFVRQASRRLGREITTVPAETLAWLSRRAWPGNVRELENLIERWVILSRGAALHVPDDERASTSAPSPAIAEGAPRTWVEWERAIIVNALREANGVIGGPTGAARRLGLQRTTLQSRMRRLGIGAPNDRRRPLGTTSSNPL